MNYKLTQQFKELKERNGFIENNSTGKVQIVISNDGTIPNELSKSAIIIDVNSKYKYSLKSSEKLYARSLNRLVAWVNVFEFSLSGDGSFDSANYYTKNEIDRGYVKKNDNIDGSKVNKMTGYVKANSYTQIAPTDSLIVALGKLEKGLELASPAMEVAQSRSIGGSFKFHYCTKSEYDTLDKMRDDSTIYLILDEITGNVDMKVYRP